MNRRHFLLATTALTSLVALTPAPAAEPIPPASEDLLADLIRANNAGIPGLLAKQERRTGHRWLGGLLNELGLHTAGGTSGFISALTCAACAPGSKYYKSPELVEPLRLAIGYLLAAQHADGTVDYYATNFHSPPDMAFILEVVSPAYLLLRASPLPALAALAPELGKFITRGGDGLVTGGVHTPNHRWVVCAALAWANTLFPIPATSPASINGSPRPSTSIPTASIPRKALRSIRPSSTARSSPSPVCSIAPRSSSPCARISR
jgi:hypothetical protein